MGSSRHNPLLHMALNDNNTFTTVELIISVVFIKTWKQLRLKWRGGGRAKRRKQSLEEIRKIILCTFLCLVFKMKIYFEPNLYQLPLDLLRSLSLLPPTFNFPSSSAGSRPTKCFGRTSFI